MANLSNDLFTILSTHTGTTSVEGRAGNDALNVRTIDDATTVAGDGPVSSFEIGPHTITTGDDTINVGTRAGIGGRNIEGVLDEIDTVLTVIGLRRLDVDRLDIDDSGDMSANTKSAGTTIKRLGLSSAGIVCVLRILDSNTAVSVRVPAAGTATHSRSTSSATRRSTPMNRAMTGDVSKVEDDGTGDLAAVAVQSWAPSRGETVTSSRQAGRSRSPYGSGLATFELDVGATANGQCGPVFRHGGDSPRSSSRFVSKPTKNA